MGQLNEYDKCPGCNDIPGKGQCSLCGKPPARGGAGRGQGRRPVFVDKGRLVASIETELLKELKRYCTDHKVARSGEGDRPLTAGEVATAALTEYFARPAVTHRWHCPGGAAVPRSLKARREAVGTIEEAAHALGARIARVAAAEKGHGTPKDVADLANWIAEMEALQDSRGGS